jgi:hypothetical protein
MDPSYEHYAFITTALGGGKEPNPRSARLYMKETDQVLYDMRSDQLGNLSDCYREKKSPKVHPVNKIQPSNQLRFNAHNYIYLNLFICGLFKDDVGSSDHTASKGIYSNYQQEFTIYIKVLSCMI